MTGRGWIVDALGAPAFERLAAELSGSELQSVLLEVMQRRARARAPAEVLADRIAMQLGAVASRKPLEHAYYSGGLRYMLWVTAPDRTEVPLFDGGAFDWLARLTSNRRAVYVASGGGAQLIALRFRADGRPPT